MAAFLTSRLVGSAGRERRVRLGFMEESICGRQLSESDDELSRQPSRRPYARFTAAIQPKYPSIKPTHSRTTARGSILHRIYIS